MIKYNPLDCLPSSAELPDSDDTPVDNELQNLIPNLLAAILANVCRIRNFILRNLCAQSSLLAQARTLRSLSLS